jgi:AcrR family transcriptional regulator
MSRSFFQTMPAPPSTKPRSLPTRASRTDGAATRRHLLDTAGVVFAERGFAGATSKEICERAGAPLASVNYHFGSREGLYEAVLIEAHRQVVSLDDLLALARSPADARSRLRTVVAHLAGIAHRPDAPWGFRVMLREVMLPSAAIPALVEKAIRPKAALMLSLVGEVMGLAPGDPAIQRGVMFTVLPCIAMVVAPRQVTSVLLPDVGHDPRAVVADFVDFTLAGLDALAASHRKPPAARARPASRRTRPAG